MTYTDKVEEEIALTPPTLQRFRPEKPRKISIAHRKLGIDLISDSQWYAKVDRGVSFPDFPVQIPWYITPSKEEMPLRNVSRFFSAFDRASSV